MKQSKKKKKEKSRVVRKENHAKKVDENEEMPLKIVLEEAASAHREATAAAEIITKRVAVVDDQTATCSSSNENFEENASCLPELRGIQEQRWIKEEAEDLLCSIVGDDPGLSLNAVRDVLCLCGYDVEKALDVLLELSTSSEQQSGGYYESSNGEEYPLESNANSGSSRNGLDEDEYKQKSKPKLKKVVASAGTVSSILGKDYVRSVAKKKGSLGLEGLQEQSWSKEEAEDFLWSIVGDDPGLSLNVVSDVLCLYGYDLEKALEVLLELSTPSEEQSGDYYEPSNREDASVARLTSDSTPCSSNTERQVKMWSARKFVRNNSKFSGSSGSHCSTKTGNLESEHPRKVLESLFSMPAHKAAEEEEPNKTNMANLVQKMASLSQQFEKDDEQLIHGDEYPVVREAAHQHWNSMKSDYHDAVTAFKNGNKECASYLSEQGRLKRRMAREADSKASWATFTARNRVVENTITIDLHGQHVEPAMKFLKFYLHLGACMPSMWSFRVITGHGSRRGLAKSKLKSAVINLLVEEGIVWSEENKGALTVKLNGRTDFSFLHSVIYGRAAERRLKLLGHDRLNDRLVFVKPVDHEDKNISYFGEQINGD